MFEKFDAWNFELGGAENKKSGKEIMDTPEADVKNAIKKTIKLFHG
jgi:hypothetical protein